jgi:hypothetical protein
VDEMMTYTAAGTGDDVRAYLEEFHTLTDADEIMTVHQGRCVDDRLASLEITAGALHLAL